jgi:hypothetical protein
MMIPFDLRVCIGWDSREPLAYAVLAHSILTRTSRPVSILPINVRALRHAYTRGRGPTEATEFSLTRFLVPYLSGYAGWSLFLDCDMLCLTDVTEILLYPLADPGKAVYVCQHDYVPRGLTKMDGHEQTRYPRKNWSSAMLFDNARCTALTPEYVSTATGLALHRFQWVPDDQIGALPCTWNYLVGEDNQSAEPPKLIHYTNGGPWLPAYADCDHAPAWWAEYRSLIVPLPMTAAERGVE